MDDPFDCAAAPLRSGQALPEPRPLVVTQHVVLTVDGWPPLTGLGPGLFDRPHAYGAVVEGDPSDPAGGATVTFAVANGGAAYRLLPGPAGLVGRSYALVEGSDTLTEARLP